MTQAERWLHALGHALASYQLYGEGHQARREASTRLYGHLEELFRTDVHPTFTFLDDTVIYRALPIHGLREWNWGRRLGQVGIRRLEFTGEVSLEALAEFLVAMQLRLAGEGHRDPVSRWPGIEAGDVTVRDVEPARLATTAAAPPPPPGADLLGEEVAALRYACERVAIGARLPLEEVEAALRALDVTLHPEGELVLPLLPVTALEDAMAVHAVNTAVLSMAFGEWLGFTGSDVRAVGRAALLHDVGMARVSREVLRSGPLSDNGRAAVERHPTEGARLLFARSSALELAATAAYEHHLRADGQGYPARRFHGDPHYVSRLITVCGAYDALRSDRSYRPARDPVAALRVLEEGAGTVYDPALATGFVDMMRRWDARRLTDARS